jgi:ribosomal protein L6P/L9E
MENFYFSKLIQIQQKNHIKILKKKSSLLIRGPLGILFLELPDNIFFEKCERGCRLFGLVKEKNLILTYYKLLLNKIKGVDLGFYQLLTINGIG